MRPEEEESHLLGPLDSGSSQSNKYDNEKEDQIEGVNFLAIYVTFLGVFLASFSESVMLSSYSAIASDFNRLSEGSWLLVAYNFGYCISLPVHGRLSEIYDPKKSLLFSYGIFGLGCLVSGLCESLVQLTVARVITGIGGAGMTIVVCIIISDNVPSNEVALYRSYENTVFLIGRSTGTPLGGLLVGTIGWRWSFFGQVPFAVSCLVFAAYKLPRSPQGSRESQTSHASLRSFDFGGLLGFSLTVMALLIFLQAAGIKSSEHPESLYISALLFVVFGVVMVFVEIYCVKDPIFPVDLMIKALGVYCLIQFLFYTSRSALLSIIEPYFVRVENSSDLYASIPLVASAVGCSIGSIISGRVIKRTHRYKTMSIVSLTAIALVHLAIFLLWRDGCSAWEMFIMVADSVAFGMINSAQFVGMIASTSKSRQAACIGAYFVCQQIGAIVGPASGQAIVQAGFKGSLVRNLPKGSEEPSLIAKILDDARFARKLGPNAQAIARTSFLYGFQFLPLFTATNMIAVLVLVTLLKEIIA